MAEALQQLILDTLDAQSSIKDSRALVLPGQKEPATSHEAQITILGALNSLLSREVRLSTSIYRIILRENVKMIKYETREVFTHALTAEGASIAKEGSHEARVWSALPVKGQGTPVTPQQLKKLVGDETAKVGQGRAFKNGWIGKEGDGFVKTVLHFF